MAYNLRRGDREQSYLMPPSMREWLSEGHLAWFTVDAVGQMDLSEFYAGYRSDGWGSAAYAPEVMVVLRRKDCTPTAWVCAAPGALRGFWKKVWGSG